MKVVSYGMTVYYVISNSFANAEYDIPLHRSPFFHSSNDGRPPMIPDLVEEYMEHTLALRDKPSSILYDYSFCFSVDQCVKKKVLSSGSPLLPTYVSELKTEATPDILPHIYKEFIPAFHSRISSQSYNPSDESLFPPLSSSIVLDSNQSGLKHQSSPSLSALLLPQTANTNLSPNSSLHRSSLLESIKKKQDEHISAFYLQQITARFIGWCYTNDYAYLIYPFLPEDIINHPKLLKKSFCSNRMLRIILLIIASTKNRLSSQNAMFMIFGYPLYVHLREIASYTTTAVDVLRKIASKQTSKPNTSNPQKKVTKGKRQVVNKNAPAKKMEQHQIVDTILIGCKALIKVPYYLSKDSEMDMFYHSKEFEAPSKLKKELLINNDRLALALKYCNIITPLIDSSYKDDPSRKKYYSYYKEEESLIVSGHRTIFPEFPLEIDELRDLSKLSDEEIKLCTSNEVEGETTRGILSCVNGISRKISLMIGMTASHLHLLSKEIPRRVVPVMKKIQALQLVSIYFQHKHEDCKLEVSEEESNAIKQEIKIEYQKVEADTELRKGKEHSDNKEMTTLGNILEDILQSIIDHAVSMKKMTIERMVQILYPHGNKLFSYDMPVNDKYPSRKEIMDKNINEVYFYVKESLVEKTQKMYEKINRARIRIQKRKKDNCKSIDEEQNRSNLEMSGHDVFETSSNESSLGENSCQSSSLQRLTQKKETDTQQFMFENQVDVMDKKEDSINMTGEKDFRSLEDTRPKRTHTLGKKTKLINSLLEGLNAPKELAARHPPTTYYMLENLLTKLQNITIFDCFKEDSASERDVINPKPRKMGLSFSCVMNLYFSLNELFYWSIPTAFLLGRKFNNRPQQNEIRSKDLTRGVFSYPGKTKSQEWMPWSSWYTDKLLKVLKSSTLFKTYFKLTEKPNRDTSTKASQIVNSSRNSTQEKNTSSSNKSSKRKKDISSDSAPAASSLALENDEGNNFLEGILKAVNIIPARYYYEPVSLVKLFDEILREFISLVKYYVKIFVMPEYPTKNEFLSVWPGGIESLNPKAAVSEDLSEISKVEKQYLPPPSVEEPFAPRSLPLGCQNLRLKRNDANKVNRQLYEEEECQNADGIIGHQDDVTSEDNSSKAPNNLFQSFFAIDPSNPKVKSQKDRRTALSVQNSNQITGDLLNRNYDSKPFILQPIHHTPFALDSAHNSNILCEENCLTHPSLVPMPHEPESAAGHSHFLPPHNPFQNPYFYLMNKDTISIPSLQPNYADPMDYFLPPMNTDERSDTHIGVENILPINSKRHALFNNDNEIFFRYENDYHPREDVTQIENEARDSRSIHTSFSNFPQFPPIHDNPQDLTYSYPLTVFPSSTMTYPPQTLIENYYHTILPYSLPPFFNSEVNPLVLDRTSGHISNDPQSSPINNKIEEELV